MPCLTHVLYEGVGEFGGGELENISLVEDIIKSETYVCVAQWCIYLLLKYLNTYGDGGRTDVMLK